MVVDFFERADKFIKSDLSPLTTLTYFLLNIPFIISQLLPIGMLLAVVIVFSIMTKNNEIMALRSRRSHQPVAPGARTGGPCQPEDFLFHGHHCPHNQFKGQSDLDGGNKGKILDPGERTEHLDQGSPQDNPFQLL